MKKSKFNFLHSNAEKKIYITSEKNNIKVPFKEVNVTSTKQDNGYQENSNLLKYDTTGPM